MPDVAERTLVDLCCGLGGISSRFRAHGGWRVISVDIDPRVMPDVVSDVRALALRRPRGPLYLWASPPCDKFSRRGQPGLYPGEPDPPLDIALAVRDLIVAWQPEAWTVENVRASRRWLNPIFGQPRCSTSGHVFWGTVLLYPCLTPRKSRVGEQRAEWVRKLKRALMPPELGDYLARSVLGGSDA